MGAIILQRVHPALALAYYACCVAAAFIFFSPIAIGLNLAAAASSALFLLGGKALLRRCAALLPFALLAALLNAAVNRQGQSIVFELWGFSLSYESLAYSLCASGMLLAVMLWFACWNAVVSSDKLIAIFGKAAPRLSLLFVMTLRFVPRLGVQARQIISAQRGLGRIDRSHSLRARLHDGGLVFSVLLTWALENAMEAADSMRARGYGLPGRGSYSLFRFGARDFILLCLLLAWAAVCVIGSLGSSLGAEFFPALVLPQTGLRESVLLSIYAIGLFFPAITDFWEVLRWRFMKLRG
ncbi:MAG: energy-coupling factor transporter transmembrane protein EcfT [Clostridium sp.]|nr:energy-coupling factor transporter transmembrane protein EcfT [Clostridium sp.]